MSGRRSTRLGGVMVAVVSAWASTAAAWQAGWCNHQSVRWGTDRIELAVMRCSAPPGSHRAGDLRAGIDGWNSVPGLGLTLEPVVGPETCRIAVNRRSELGYVRPEQLDDARGLTRLVFTGQCPPLTSGWPGSNPLHIVEADVLIADHPHDRVGPPDGCDRHDPNAPYRRALVMHELGHVIGLRHEEGAMAVMNRTSSAGRYCGPRAMEPHPDDRAGARWLYPGDDEPVRDVAAIAFHLGEAGRAQPVVGSRFYRVCPGDALDVRWAVANQGTVDAVTRVAWYVSDNDIISRRDHLAGTGPEVIVPTGGFHSQTQRIVVPDLPRRRGATGDVGPWWLGFLVDPDGSGFEVPATNDWTYTELRLWLRPPEECGG